ncbi:type IV toxin-antitoxin system AbiEi family antitoxin domain-containing protein [Actinomadura gamaensis]|uniref:Type IV toxin-antitoxin system AbiEi family antitoxin domain-containing protein n=1 Tax=Actinomadura gamaensis TaxID=1763541 RepID=A0ABV9TQM7_9ACTN
MSLAASLAAASTIAEAQWGLFTTRQAQAAGAARRDLVRLEQAGVLERVAHGVYFVAGAPRPELLELRAAWLQLSPGTPVGTRTPGEGVISHMSAALVHDLGTPDPLGHEFTFPATRRVRTRRSDVGIHHGALGPDDIAWVDQMLVTSVPRTLSDLAAVNTDGGHLGEMLSDALDRGLLTPTIAASALTSHSQSYGLPPRDGPGLLRLLLSEIGR